MILLHGFGQRFDLTIPLYLYLFAACGVVFLSFVLVVLFAGTEGDEAIRYPRRRIGWLTRLAKTPWPRAVGGVIGVLALVAVFVTGLFGSTNSFYNPAEYIVWIFFWAVIVILTGLVGNLWYLLNPWAAIYDVLARVFRLRPVWTLPESIGIWPAAAAYFSFACLELTSGLASRPVIVALSAALYTFITLAGMVLFGRDAWLQRCEAFTVLLGIVSRFGPVEAERDANDRITGVYLRPWGAGLLQPSPSGWDRVGFVILMLSSLAFDGILSTPAWQDFTVTLEPLWLPLGVFGFFFVRTLGFLLLTLTFFLVFVAFMEAVIYLGQGRADVKRTMTAFALTLVPIALVYNAAHNYSYVLVQSQYVLPLLNDPLQKGWHLWPAVANFTPNFTFAQASTVWYAQIVLIVVGHIVAVILSHLRANSVFRGAQRALLSQYPMLLLMVIYTFTSLWILAQPITREA